jgi:hypothetical protein
LCACSPSSPSFKDTISSDSHPVTGQKVLFQVRTVSDRYPMTYLWQADGGVLTPGEDTDNFAYWTAPETPGQCHVTCRVTDSDNNENVYTFKVQVSARTLQVLYSPETNGISALSMQKETISNLGGLWVSLDNGQVRYLSSNSNTNTSWEGAFRAITVEYNNSMGSHAFWGAYDNGTQGNIISEQASITAELTCPYLDPDGFINAMAVSYEDPGFYLLVGAETGLFWYHTDGSTELWHDYGAENGIGRTSDFALDPAGDIGYAATDVGIYPYSTAFFTIATDPLYHDDDPALAVRPACALAVDEDGSVWHVTKDALDQEQVYKGMTLITRPDDVACTLAIDISGNVWCGKYYWDGSAWHVPDGLDGYTITKVATTGEGFMFFITSSGALLRY